MTLKATIVIYVWFEGTVHKSPGKGSNTVLRRVVGYSFKLVAGLFLTISPNMIYIRALDRKIQLQLIMVVRQISTCP